MLVYNKLVIFVLFGVSGESEYVAYKTRSVHEGTRLVLKEKPSQLQQQPIQSANTHLYLSTSPSLYL